MCIRNRPASIVYKLLILLLSGFSLFFLVGLPGGFLVETLNYFPTVAVLLSAVFYFVAVLHGIGRTATRGARGEASFAPHFKGAVVLVNLINIAIMRQQILPAAQSLLSGNISMENIATLAVAVVLPFLVLLDWLLFDPKGRFRTSDPVLWLIPAIIYYLYTLVRARLGQPLSTGEQYPYDFLSPDYLGWSGVLFNILFIVVILLIVGFFLVLFDMLMGSKAKTNEEEMWDYAGEDYDEDEYDEENAAQESILTSNHVSQDTAPLPLHEYMTGEEDEENLSGGLFNHEIKPEENFAAAQPAFTQDTPVFLDTVQNSDEIAHEGYSIFDRPSEELTTVPTFSQRDILAVPKVDPPVYPSVEKTPVPIVAQKSSVTVESLFDAIDRQQATVRTSLGTIELPETENQPPVPQAQPTQISGPEAAPEPSPTPPQPYRSVAPKHSAPDVPTAETALVEETIPVYNSPFSAPIVSQPQPIQPPAPVQGGFSGVNITPQERRRTPMRPHPVLQKTSSTHSPLPAQPPAPQYQPAPPAAPSATYKSSPTYSAPAGGQQQAPASFQPNTPGRAPFIPVNPQPQAQPYPPAQPVPAPAVTPRQQYSRPTPAIPPSSHPAQAPPQATTARPHRPGFYSPQLQHGGASPDNTPKTVPAAAYPPAGTPPEQD